MNEEILNSIVEDRISDVILFTKQFMKNHTIKQRELARRMNVTEATVSMWFARTNDLSLATFFKICTVLGLPDIEKYLMREVVKDAAETILNKSRDEFNHMIDSLLGEYHG